MSQYRQSAYYDELFLGVVTPLRFICYELRDGKRRPLDLTQYDGGIVIQLYDSESSVSIRQQATLTALTDAADKVTDIDGTTLVAAKCSGSITVTGSTGEIRAKLVGTKSSAKYLIGKPWKLTVRSPGPSS